MESWPLSWQLIATALTSILASGAVATALNWYLNREKHTAETDATIQQARKTELERLDLAADIGWETVERMRCEQEGLLSRVEHLEEQDEALRTEHQALQQEHRELRARYQSLRLKSDGQERRIQQQEERITQLERELERSRCRERALRDMLKEHGIDPEECGL